MKVEINGKQYKNFQEITARISVDELCNSFSFQAGISTSENIPFKRGDECAIYVDGERVLTGYIELINGTGDGQSRDVTFIGRDKTADIVDSTINVLPDIKPPITLKQIAEIIIEHIGADIDVVDLFYAYYTKGEDLVSFEPGESAFDVLEKFARKKSVILTSNSEGALTLRRASGLRRDTPIVQRATGQGAGNNVLTYSFSFDSTGLFNRYETVGNGNVNLLSLLGVTDPKKVIDKNGFVTDRFIREGRQLIIASENAGNDADMKQRSEWEANIRRARSRRFSAKVDGYRDRLGDLWSVNTILPIVSDSAQINGNMLLNTVTYRLDGDGRTTELEFIGKDAYTLKLEEPTTSDSGDSLESLVSGY